MEPDAASPAEAQTAPEEGAPAARPEPRFAEFGAMTNFSFLRGASHPEEIVLQAAELGLAGIGIADRNSLAGVVRAHIFAKEKRSTLGDLRIAPGARLVFIDGTPDLLVYPQDRAAYGRLCRILTKGNREAPKGECRLKLEHLLARNEGLQVIALPGAGDKREGKVLSVLAETFGPRFRIGVTMLYDTYMVAILKKRIAFSEKIGAPLIATNDALMHAPERRRLADVLTCIREKTTLENAGTRLLQNAERCLKGPRVMTELFYETPGAIDETIRFLDGLSFSLDELAHRYPEELREGYATPQDALAAYALEGARWRYPEGTPARVTDAL